MLYLLSMTLFPQSSSLNFGAKKTLGRSSLNWLILHTLITAGIQWIGVATAHPFFLPSILPIYILLLTP